MEMWVSCESYRVHAAECTVFQPSHRHQVHMGTCSSCSLIPFYFFFDIRSSAVCGRKSFRIYYSYNYTVPRKIKIRRMSFIFNANPWSVPSAIMSLSFVMLRFYDLSLYVQCNRTFDGAMPSRVSGGVGDQRTFAPASSGKRYILKEELCWKLTRRST